MTEEIKYDSDNEITGKEDKFKTTIIKEAKVNQLISRKTNFDTTLQHKKKLETLLGDKVIKFSMSEEEYDRLQKGIPDQPKILVKNTKYYDDEDYFRTVSESELEMIMYKANVNKLNLKANYSTEDSDSKFEFFTPDIIPFENSNDLKKSLIQGNIKKIVLWHDSEESIVPVIFLKFKGEIALQPILFDDFIKLWDISRVLAANIFGGEVIENISINGINFYKGQLLDNLLYEGKIIPKNIINNISPLKTGGYDIKIKCINLVTKNSYFITIYSELLYHYILFPTDEFQIKNLKITKDSMCISEKTHEKLIIKNIFKNMDNNIFFELDNDLVYDQINFINNIRISVKSKKYKSISIKYNKSYKISNAENIEVIRVYDSLIDDSKALIEISKNLQINGKSTNILKIDDFIDLISTEIKEYENLEHIQNLIKNIVPIDVIDSSAINKGVLFSGKNSYGDMSIYSEERENKSQALHIHSKRELSFTMLDSNNKNLLDTIISILVNTVRNEEINNPDYILREIHRNIREKNIDSNIAKASFLGIKYKGGDTLDCFYAGDTRFYVIRDNRICFQKELEQNANGLANGIATSSPANQSILNIKQELKAETINLKQGDNLLILSKGFDIEEDKTEDIHILKGLFYKFPMEVVIRGALRLSLENQIALFKIIKNINARYMQEVFKSLNINNDLKTLDEGKIFAERLLNLYNIKLSNALNFYNLLTTSSDGQKCLKIVENGSKDKKSSALNIVLKYIVTSIFNNQDKDIIQDANNFIKKYHLTDIKNSFAYNLGDISNINQDDLLNFYSIVFSEIEKVSEDIIKIVKVILTENESNRFVQTRKKTLTNILSIIRAQKLEPHKKYKNILFDLKEHFVVNDDELTVFSMKLERTDFKNNILCNKKYLEQVRKAILSGSPSEYIIYKPDLINEEHKQKKVIKNDFLRDTVFGKNISMKELLAKEGIDLS